MNDLSSKAIPPGIQGSSNYLSNETSILKTTKILSNKITNNIINIENGLIMNLVNPINNRDIATKQYVDTNIISSGIPGGINTDVQFNNTGIFAGSTNLQYIAPQLTLTGTATDSVSTINQNTIINLNSPIDNTDGANKGYSNTMNDPIITSITATSNQTYTAFQMINGFIERSGNNTTLIDLTATAQQIINSFPSVTTKSTASFTVKNVTNLSDSSIVIVPNLGITFKPNNFIITLANNYQLNALIYVTNANEGEEAVTILINSICFISNEDTILVPVPYYIPPSLMAKETAFNTPNPGSSLGNPPSYFNSTLTVLSNYLFNLIPGSFLFSSIYTYSINDLLNGIFIRNVNSPITDSLPTRDQFIAKIPFPYENSSGSIMSGFFNSAGVTFIVQNIGTANLTIGTADWTVDSNSSYIIPAGKNGIFGLTVYSPQTPDPIQTTIRAYIYTIAIVDRSG